MAAAARFSYKKIRWRRKFGQHSATAGTRLDTRHQRRVSRVFGVLYGGSVSALITLCYAIGYGLMIISDSLERYVSVGIPSSLIGVCLVGFVITLWSSQQFRIAGPDSNTVAILAVSLASIVWILALKEAPNRP